MTRGVAGTEGDAVGLMDDLAATRVHVLAVGVPGFPLLRLRALAAVRRRGWVAAVTPADAEVLLVCGPAGEALRAAVDAAWARVPVPRARRIATDAAAIEALLDSAARVLGDRPLQAESAAARSEVAPSVPDPARMGPVLPDWPAGLVVDLVERDGAVTGATVAPGVAAAVEEDPLPPDEAAFVQACDRAARVLRLAGWPAEAGRLDRCIDGVLAGEAASSRLPDVRRAAARASRSVLLRAGLAPVPGEALHRLLVILGDAERSASGEPGVDEPLDPRGLEQALRGADLDQVRLLVAIAGADPVLVPPVDDATPAGAAPVPPAGGEPVPEDGQGDADAPPSVDAEPASGAAPGAEGTAPAMPSGRAMADEAASSGTGTSRTQRAAPGDAGASSTSARDEGGADA